MANLSELAMAKRSVGEALDCLEPLSGRGRLVGFYLSEARSWVPEGHRARQSLLSASPSLRNGEFERVRRELVTAYEAL